MATTLKRATALFDVSRRGLLLDVVVLAANLVAMRPLTGWLGDVVRRAAADDRAAMGGLFGLAVALFVLAPVGATLKRRHYHRRRGAGGGAGFEGAAGCLFNPIFYFCLAAVIFAAVNAFIMQRVFGNRDPGATIFVTSIFVGLALIIGHTFLVYRYFSPPRNPPKRILLKIRSPKACQ